MNSDKFVKHISVFMIFLVVSLTVTTVDAYAGFITGSIRTHGINDVYNSLANEGYRRSVDDQAIIEVVAEMPDGGVITKNNLKIGEAPDFISFNQECVKIPLTNRYYCKYVDDRDFNGGKHPFTVKLYATTTPSQYTTPVAQVSSVLYSDEIPPGVEILSVRPDGGNISVTYNVWDQACDFPECTGKCSGIDRVTFPDANVIDYINSSECRLNNRQMSIYVPGTGERAISIVAYDRVGQSTTVSTLPFLIDHSPPVISPSYTLVKDGSVLGFVSTSAPDRLITGAEIVLRITENNLSAVYADLSELNSYSQIQDYSNVPGVCTKEGSYYDCRWSNLNLIFSSARPEINVTAIDSSGNSVSAVSKGSLQVDDIKPVVKFLGSSYCNDDGKCYIAKQDNTLIAIIEEAGSGFNFNYSLFGSTVTGKRMILDLTSIMGGAIANQRVFANDCVKLNSNDWACYWDGINLAFDRESYRIFVVEGSSDDSQNPVSGVLESTVYYDNVKPVVTDITVYPITEFGSPINGTLIGGRHVSATAKVMDTLDVRAYADFSEVVTGAGTVEGECSLKTGGYSLCVWDDVGIAKGTTQNSIFKDREIEFSFSDGVGNTVNETVQVDILYQDDSPPNYWTFESTSVSPRPSKVDRNIVRLVPLKIYFKTPLEKTGVENVRPLVIELDECAGPDSDKLSSAEVLFGNDNGEDVSWINLMLNPHTAEKDKLSYDFSCTLKIVSVVQDRIVTVPEIDTINLTVPLYDLGLILEDDINKKIDDVKSDPLVKLTENSAFNSLVKLVQIGKKICNILTLVTTALNLVSTALQALDALAIFDLTRTVKRTAGKAQDIQSGNVRGILGQIHKFCDFLNCNKPIFGKNAGDFFYSQNNEKKNFGFLGNINKWATSPKDSLILSIGTLCIPGIIFNLQKYRKIQCAYVSCLKKQVPTGTPMSLCEYYKDYSTCQFWWGEIFSVIPFAKGLQNAVKSIYNALSHPVSLIFGFAEEKWLACSSRAASGESFTGYNIACVFTYSIPAIKRYSEDLKEFANTESWQIDDSICSILEED